MNNNMKNQSFMQNNNSMQGPPQFDVPQGRFPGNSSQTRVVNTYALPSPSYNPQPLPHPVVPNSTLDPNNNNDSSPYDSRYIRIPPKNRDSNNPPPYLSSTTYISLPSTTPSTNPPRLSRKAQFVLFGNKEITAVAAESDNNLSSSKTTVPSTSKIGFINKPNIAVPAESNNNSTKKVLPIEVAPKQTITVVDNNKSNTTGASNPASFVLVKRKYNKNPKEVKDNTNSEKKERKPATAKMEIEEAYRLWHFMKILKPSGTLAWKKLAEAYNRFWQNKKTAAQLKAYYSARWKRLMKPNSGDKKPPEDADELREAYRLIDEKFEMEHPEKAARLAHFRSKFAMGTSDEPASVLSEVDGDAAAAENKALFDDDDVQYIENVEYIDHSPIAMKNNPPIQVPEALAKRIACSVTQLCIHYIGSELQQQLQPPDSTDIAAETDVDAGLVAMMQTMAIMECWTPSKIGHHSVHPIVGRGKYVPNNIKINISINPSFNANTVVLPRIISAAAASKNNSQQLMVLPSQYRQSNKNKYSEEAQADNTEDDSGAGGKGKLQRDRKKKVKVTDILTQLAESNLRSIQEDEKQVQSNLDLANKQYELVLLELEQRKAESKERERDRKEERDRFEQERKEEKERLKQEKKEETERRDREKKEEAEQRKLERLDYLKATLDIIAALNQTNREKEKP